MAKHSGLDEPPLVLFGAGGHGRVVADAAIAGGVRFLGFLDDVLAAGTQLAEGVVIGGTSELSGLPMPLRGLAAVGDNRRRAALNDVLSSHGVTLTSLSHPTSVVSPSATLDAGVQLLALCVVNCGAMVGRGTIINTAAVVEHDVVVGEYAHISPNATLLGGARVGAFAQVGAGATVLPGVCVGRGATVGAGAVVIKDVPADETQAGVPARSLRSGRA